MTREQKLEEALRAAMKMRRLMFDIAPELLNFMAPRASVEEFDRKMIELAEKGSLNVARQ